MKLDEGTSKPIFSKEKKMEISKNLLSTIIKIPENCIKEMNIGISSIKIVNMNNLYKIYRLNKFLDKCEKLVISRGYEIITNKNKKGIIVKICLGGLIIKELFSTSKEQIIINYTEWILKYEEAKIFFFKPISVLKTEALAEKQRKKTEAKAQRIKNNLALEVQQKNEVDKIKGTKADKKDFYEKNKSKFVDPETYEASHILVKTEALAEKHITEFKGILTKKEFDNLLKDLELTKKEFSNIIGISYITINNWNIIPSLVNSWFENYIKAKDMNKVISTIKSHIKE
ncbi:hypothetical protein O8C74_07380 [Aliarcobacter butzleri]|uniref:hypothetical protein n=1 Tax=Aliarcobacter butzleri TaxID=28197 RepID=UPI00263DB761|nr:hypothetical protein [Aliarcobacter butzleri]MDN5086888.1 hypothetical protein [Aliarcobacter butzleri]